MGDVSTKGDINPAFTIHESKPIHLNSNGPHNVRLAMIITLIYLVKLCKHHNLDMESCAKGKPHGKTTLAWVMLLGDATPNSARLLLTQHDAMTQFSPLSQCQSLCEQVCQVCQSIFLPTSNNLCLDCLSNCMAVGSIVFSHLEMPDVSTMTQDGKTFIEMWGKSCPQTCQNLMEKQ